MTIEERLEVLFRFWGVDEKDVPGLIRAVLKVVNNNEY